MPHVGDVGEGRGRMNAGVLTEPRLSMFKELLELCEKYRRKNQYV